MIHTEEADLMMGGDVSGQLNYNLINSLGPN
jgi:hypothetical protein